MAGNERRLWYIKAQWKRICGIGAADESQLIHQMDAFEQVMRKLISMGESAFLVDLVCGTSEDCVFVGILREDAVELLLKAGALEEARRISRLHYEECGHLIGIMIAIAGASRERPDLDLARLTIRMHVEIGLGLVIFLTDLWKATREERDILDAREVADFLPPEQKSEAYLTIGRRTGLREDLITSIEATRGIEPKSRRREVLKRLGDIFCSHIGTTFDGWLARQADEKDGRVLH